MELELPVEGGWAKLEEQTGEGRAAWTTVEPEDYGIGLWVVPRFKEPCI